MDTQNQIISYKPCVRTHFSWTLGEERAGIFPSPQDEQAYHEGNAIIQIDKCVYCGSPLQLNSRPSSLYSNAFFDIKVKNCEACGWWCHTEGWSVTGSFDPDDDLSRLEMGFTYIEGVVQAFDASSLELPLTILRAHLQKKPDVLYDIHHRKFEELMADILADFFECEVRLTAQTVDGGVDIYLVEGDDTRLVQVKRRTSKSATEGVKAIRELAGVLLISGHTKGIVVSTAPSYSRQAKVEAAAPELISRGYSLQLMCYQDILDALRVVTGRAGHIPVWGELLKAPFENSSIFRSRGT